MSGYTPKHTEKSKAVLFSICSHRVFSAELSALKLARFNRLSFSPYVSLKRAYQKTESICIGHLRRFEKKASCSLTQPTIALHNEIIDHRSPIQLPNPSLCFVCGKLLCVNSNSHRFFNPASIRAQTRLQDVWKGL